MANETKVESPIEETEVDVKNDQGSSSAADPQSEALDLDKYGDTEISSGGTKPEFPKVTRMKVKGAELMTSKERKTQKRQDGQEETFYQVFLKVTYLFEESEVYENYGGGKLYVSGDESKSARFWVGENSALGKLVAKAKEYFEFDGKLKSLPGVIGGTEVGVKTEVSTVNGVDYKKNIIQHFVV